MKLESSLCHVEDTVMTTAVGAAFCTLQETASERWQSAFLNIKQVFHDFRIVGWSLRQKYVVQIIFENLCHDSIEILFSDHFAGTVTQDLGPPAFILSMLNTCMSVT